MEKSYALQCLDFACIKTMQKGGDYNSLGHISNSILKLLSEGVTIGFTSKEGARGYVSDLSSDDIEKEILANLIRTKAVERENDLLGTLSTTKKIEDDNLNSEESLFLIYDKLSKDGMNNLKWILNKYPNLFTELCISFANTRYFDTKDYGIKKLDEVKLNEEDIVLINKIKSYYSETEEKQPSK